MFSDKHKLIRDFYTWYYAAHSKKLTKEKAQVFYILGLFRILRFDFKISI